MVRSFLSLLFLVFINIWTIANAGLRANETELLAYQALQAYASLPSLYENLSNEVKNAVKVKAIPNLFAQQQGVKPDEGSYQLENFGALKPWDEILTTLKQSPNNRLLILIRHGQAWENLNPTSNANCEFTLGGKTIQNFDSELSPEGRRQANDLNAILTSTASSNTSSNNNLTWYETIGLAQDSTVFITSPLSRTMQTTEAVFAGLPLSATSGNAFQVHELIRATLGRDVCNSRHSVNTPTKENPLSSPWETGCDVPTASLQELYGGVESRVKFNFNIRPAGGAGFGLISDYDQLWRSDVPDEEVQVTRATAFLAQVYENTPDSSVVAVVTHGEIIQAIYTAAGEIDYGAKNTEVVPLLVVFE